MDRHTTMRLLSRENRFGRRSASSSVPGRAPWNPFARVFEGTSSHCQSDSQPPPQAGFLWKWDNGTLLSKCCWNVAPRKAELHTHFTSNSLDVTERIERQKQKNKPNLENPVGFCQVLRLTWTHQWQAEHRDVDRTILQRNLGTAQYKICHNLNVIFQSLKKKLGVLYIAPPSHQLQRPGIS